MNKNTLLQRALATDDVHTLHLLVEEACKVIAFQDSQLEFSKKREAKALNQIKTQVEMINNLEKTIYRK